jgi:hypothetical protein
MLVAVIRNMVPKLLPHCAIREQMHREAVVHGQKENK